MNENENNFESLRRLLALKRHEIPPPRYFNDFSSRVIARIHGGEAESKMPWLLKWIHAFEAKPAYAGGFALTLCSLLLFGIVFAEKPESSPRPFLQATAPAVPPFVMASAASLPKPTGQPLMAMDNTNPVVGLPAGASFFNQDQAFAQQVSYSLPGN